jgi:hypothetical protein
MKKGQIGIIVALITICLVLILILIGVLSFASFSPVSGKVVYSYESPRYCETIKVPYVVEEKYYDYSTSGYRVVFSDYESDYKESGAYRDRYLVRVKNTGNLGQYFDVKFYIYDYRGEKSVKTVRKYLERGETQSFYYPNYDSRNYGWDYQVIPENSQVYLRTRNVVKYEYVQRCY